MLETAIEWPTSSPLMQCWLTNAIRTTLMYDTIWSFPSGDNSCKAGKLLQHWTYGGLGVDCSQSFWQHCSRWQGSWRMFLVHDQGSRTLNVNICQASNTSTFEVVDIPHKYYVFQSYSLLFIDCSKLLLCSNAPKMKFCWVSLFRNSNRH
jgi:hypothetical protein